MASFTGLLLWWLLSVALSALAWPLSYHLFKQLPDRGLAFSRLLGWLFTGYVAWLLGFALNHALTSVLAWGLLAFASYKVWQPRRLELKAWAQANSGLIFAYEAAFLGLFVLWSLVRMKHPAIEGQEKFMDFAFFNAIQRDSQLPPADPWMAGPGLHINYYYFGYFLNAAFARLLPVSPEISYNLAVSNNFALCGLGALGLGYNLTRALWPGLASAAALILFGNLHGALQVLGIQWQGAFNWWEPTRLIKDVVKDGKYLNAWWWGASPAALSKAGLTAEAARDGLISEFPAFSFLHGDLHPHFTALPIALLVLGLGLNLLKSPAQGSLSLPPRWDARSQAWLALITALSALFMANTWDLPAYGLLASLLVLAQQHGAGRFKADWFKQWLLPSALLLAGLLLLALPFLVFFQNPAKGLGLHGARTGLRDSLVFWGVFIAVLGPFVWLKALALASPSPGPRGPVGAAPAASAQARPQVRSTCASCGAKLRPGKAICGACGTRAPEPEAPVVEAAMQAAPAWAQSLALGLFKPATLKAKPALLALALGLTALIVGLAWAAPSSALFFSLGLGAALILAQRGGTAEASFAAALVLVASLMVLVPEFAYLRDVFEGNPSLTRMNTVFKFYFQAWVLFAMALGLALHWSAERLKGTGLWRQAYLGAFAVLGLAALVYPAKAIAFVWADFDQWARMRPTLDGAAWMRRDMPADYAAIQRLRAQVPGQPVIAEAVGGAYTHYARVSAYTGFRAVLGWANHESQWRKDWPTAVERDVDELFQTLDLVRARQLLNQYRVEYVYVGQLEQEKYAASGGLQKFAQLGQPILQEMGVTVYKVNQ